MDNQFTTSLWGDEGFSAILSMNSIPKIIEIISRDTSPPLFNITEHMAFQLFGTDEVVIRGLAFFYYLIAVLFSGLIANHFWGRKTAIIASVLTFLNPFFFIYAFEGRMYSIMAAGVAASMYFFLKRRWIPYVIATLWALYSHHFAIFAVFAQGIWFMFTLYKSFTASSKKESKTERSLALQMFKAFMFVGLGYLPWLYPLYLQTSKVGTGFWLATPTIKEYFGLIFDYLGHGIRHSYAPIALYLVLAALIVRRWKDNIKANAFLLLWFLVPITMTWLISQVFTSVFYNRYLVPSIPAAMILLASNWRKNISYPVVAAIIVFFAIIDFHYFTNPTKEPFRELATYVQETRTDNDILVNWDAGRHKLWEAKYYDIPAPIYHPGGGELPYFVGTALMTDEDFITEIPEEIDRVGVIQPSEKEAVQLEGFEEESAKQFGSIWFIWLRRL